MFKKQEHSWGGWCAGKKEEERRTGEWPGQDVWVITEGMCLRRLLKDVKLGNVTTLFILQSYYFWFWVGNELWGAKGKDKRTVSTSMDTWAGRQIQGGIIALSNQWRV